MKTLWNFIKEHPTKTAAVIIALIILWLTYGCEPKTVSVVEPPKMVNKYELKAELDLVVARFENKFTSIAQEEEFRRALFNSAVNMYTTGQIDPVGVLITLSGIFGLGAVGDDVRLRRKIKTTISTPPTV